MKNILRLSLLILFSLCAINCYSQDKCKVLKSSISDTYEGKCKNGLANGKGIATGTDRYEGQFINGLPQGVGTYTWANGATYSGEWVEGMRHGIGKYSAPGNGNDSIQEGLWQKDAYKGPKPAKPNVTYKSGVDRYNFKKTYSPFNRVMVDIFMNGVRNKTITNLSMTSSSGQDVTYGFQGGFVNVVFPVTIKIGYTTANKLNSVLYKVNFDFVISEPGDWLVELQN